MFWQVISLISFDITRETYKELSLIFNSWNAILGGELINCNGKYTENCS